MRQNLSAQGICTQCKLEKPLRDGKPRWCAECYKIYQREYHRQYGNSEAKKRARDKYRQTDKWRINHKNGKHRRRSRLRTGTVKLEQWNSLVELYDCKCAICREEKELTMDHIIPLSKGGEHKIENIQPLCMECNLRKRDTMPVGQNSGV